MNRWRDDERPAGVDDARRTVNEPPELVFPAIDGSFVHGKVRVERDALSLE